MFEKSAEIADQLLEQGKKLKAGGSLASAGIDATWLIAYGVISQRLENNRSYGLTRYPYEAGPSVSPFSGGFFDMPEWPFRKNLAKHKSMRAVMEYEAKYTNASGYWCAFHHSAIDLRNESLTAKKEEDAKTFDVWSIIAVRYALRVTGLRTEFYRMAAEDPVHALLVLPALEHQSVVRAADNLDETMGKMESHMHTQLFKAVATLQASNETKKALGQGGPAADEQ